MEGAVNCKIINYSSNFVNLEIMDLTNNASWRLTLSIVTLKEEVEGSLGSLSGL